MEEGISAANKYRRANRGKKNKALTAQQAQFLVEFLVGPVTNNLGSRGATWR
jgi:hypothetical protein